MKIAPFDMSHVMTRVEAKRVFKELATSLMKLKDFLRFMKGQVQTEIARGSRQEVGN